MQIETWRPKPPLPYVTATDGDSRIQATRIGDDFEVSITTADSATGRGTRTMLINIGQWREFIEQMGQLPA